MRLTTTEYVAKSDANEFADSHNKADVRKESDAAYNNYQAAMEFEEDNISAQAYWLAYAQQLEVRWNTNLS